MGRNTLESFVGHDATHDLPPHTARLRRLVLPDTRFRRSLLRVRLVATACAAALLVGAPAWSQNQLPALGDPASEDFNLGTERRLGDEIMREIRADPDYLDDPVLLGFALHVVL